MLVRSSSLLMNFQRAIIFSFLTERENLGGPIHKIVSSPNADRFARLEPIFEKCRRELSLN